ncbi:patatin-like phospholipase family protein [Roseateles violae]|uniref:Patatin-like phospholipase family protein n=1 Tax=Roseateles violae TaxID=3058042 RepID=A0ABT8DVW6_9BURK|nr:patatin-like phospholipase family protein [Pelomonas sp. PFR6]MDN3922451.1 patatin-like phospholipase family protein [Pelomonas sp. PFR6]
MPARLAFAPSFILCFAALLPAGRAEEIQPPAAEAARPKLGLVLSGGGARGLAHVGVLKVLERERVPADLITGTSMGAIIGGLYASGMSAADLERELLLVSWDRVFAGRVERQQLSQRRKEEDFEFSPVIEFGMRDGELRAPQSTLSSRGLEILLRRYTRPVRQVRNFDQLPTPFRAIATDMETGAQVVLDDGDLALAMRSSMSVPGVFAPTEMVVDLAPVDTPPGGRADAPAKTAEERILGDGGLVNNLPIDVARGMGAQSVIAVNVGTPLAPRKTLSSLVGVTAQMINILTEQNVQRSIASLGEQDLLITPLLGELTSGDFDKVRELIAQGERAAEELLPQLRRFAVPPEAYAQWQLARRQRDAQGTRLAAIRFEGSELTNPAVMVRQLQSKPGQTFDAERAERDAQHLASSGDYERVDYHVEPQADGSGDALVYTLEDKPWGPNYFRVGIDLSTDMAGDSFFNLRVSHNRHWLTPSGTEWRNQLSIGHDPRLFSELYQPLQLGKGSDWFVSGWGEVGRRNIPLYEDGADRPLLLLNRSAATLGLDLGQPWAELGEVRLGLVRQDWRIASRMQVAPEIDAVLRQHWREYGLRLLAVVDQLDFANFPQRGYRLSAELTSGKQSNGKDVRDASFTRTELQANGVMSWGAHTLNLYGRTLDARQSPDSTQGPYTLGGFQQLSGYKKDQLSGDTLVFGRATYYLRLRDKPVLTRGFFVGGSLEIGNAWRRSQKFALEDLRPAGSVFLGADTGLGPLYLALGYAPGTGGGTAVYLFIGRP